uniref:Uncharacterized protein n=1 Tax=Anopheles coluzzii TaxID=1518534 RepID=A0A8W7PTZ5_ANOCL
MSSTTAAASNGGSILLGGGHSSTSSTNSTVAAMVAAAAAAAAATLNSKRHPPSATECSNFTITTTSNSSRNALKHKLTFDDEDDEREPAVPAKVRISEQEDDDDGCAWAATKTIQTDVAVSTSAFCKADLTSYRFQRRVPRQCRQIRPRITLRQLGQMGQIGIAQRAALLLQQPPQQQLARIAIGQRHTRFGNRRSAASSSSWGRLVAAITTIRSASELAGSPSNWTKNSVFRRRVASCSLLLRSDSTESTSSMKMIDGCSSRATANRARTSFSPSPTYLLVSVAAEMLKNVAEHSVATARASSVLPLPGGPNSSNPFAGVRSPVKSSGRTEGKMTISWSACFATSWPAMSCHWTLAPPSTISSMMICTSFGSTPLTEICGCCCCCCC